MGRDFCKKITVLVLLPLLGLAGKQNAGTNQNLKMNMKILYQK